MVARALLAAALLAVACRGPEPDLSAIRESLPAQPPKIVLIGLDGADWRVARPLIDAGRMPVLASLVAEGSSGELRSIPPMISPALWTTVATGVERRRHGIHDFVYKKREGYGQPIVNSSVRRTLALWNILSGLGLSVGVLDWYATWPAEAVNGFVVSDRIRTTAPEAAGVTYPAYESLRESLSVESLPALAPLPALERFRNEFDPVPEGLDKGLREDLFRYRVAKSLYRTHRPDFFAFYFKGIDAVGHFYWKYHEPDNEVFGEVDPAEIDRWGGIVHQYYELCDQLLGGFLKIVDRDALVLIVSDHGFRAFGRPDNLIFDLDRLFSVMGLLEFEDPGSAGRRSEREIRMAGTRAYTHEGTKIVSTFGERDRPVYLNVSGRDPEGVVDGTNLPRARRKIANKLRSLRTDLGSRVFSRVTIANDPADPDSPVQEPDLHVRVNREIAFDYDLMIDGRAYPLFETFLWEYGNISGTHREEGILVARGPGIRAGAALEPASLLDIAPTVLHLAGAPVPRDFAGHVIRGMLVDPRGGNGLKIATYESLIDREPAGATDDPIDAEYRERLKALGYVQ